MVYCSGSIGVSPTTKALVEGGVGDRTVSNASNNQRNDSPSRELIFLLGTSSSQSFGGFGRGRLFVKERGQSQHFLVRHDEFCGDEQGL